MSSKGKGAEKKLTRYLKARAARPEFWYHRFPDAGVCRGRLPKQPADYLIIYKGVPVLLEVKEEKQPVGIQAARLTQTPKMKRFCMADGQAYFLIYHTELDKWRLIDVHDVKQKKGTLSLKQAKTFDTVKDLFDTLLPLIKVLQILPD